MLLLAQSLYNDSNKKNFKFLNLILEYFNIYIDEQNFKSNKGKLTGLFETVQLNVCDKTQFQKEMKSINDIDDYINDIKSSISEIGFNNTANIYSIQIVLILVAKLVG